MLWTALHLPHLSLQCLLRGAPSSGPVAIQDKHQRLVSCNDVAQAAGIHCGMPVSAAFALVPQLRLFTHDVALEKRALTALASWSIQFTPSVSVAAAGTVLLEIGGCLTLFGGLRPLLARLRRGLTELGYQSVVAVAPTPTAAELLARAGIATHLTDRHELRRALAPLPILLLDLSAESVRQLGASGIRTIGQCLALPRDGLARRFGQKLLDQLDRALERLPDARAPFVVPSRYHGQLPLPAPVQESEPLLFAAKRLLLELGAFLQSRQQGVTQLRLDLEHGVQRATSALPRVTPVTLSLSTPSRDTDHLLTLLREKLATTPLPSTVEAIALIAEQSAPLIAHSATLFGESLPTEQERWQIIEHLRARLGPQSVYGLALCADHRPERAYRICEPGTKSRDPGYPRRPLWLIDPPRPLAEFPSTESLLDGPERIESGWWDNADVTRDYFIATDATERKLWIFRTRRGEKQWFLHGIFA
jgi:protein ImuB